MTLLTAILIDDDQINIDLLSKLLTTYCPEISISASATNVDEGIDLVRSYRPQILFLDMEIHDKLGFDVLDQIQTADLQVVLITAYEKYAVQAFKYQVHDYLLKPIKIDELLLAVQRCKKRIEEQKPVAPLKHLSIHHAEHIDLISVEDILYLESSSSNTLITCKNGKTLVSGKKLKDYEPLLRNPNYARVHKSFIINCNFVVGFTKHRPPLIAMINGTEIPLSPNYKMDLQSKMGIL